MNEHHNVIAVAFWFLMKFNIQRKRIKMKYFYIKLNTCIGDHVDWLFEVWYSDNLNLGICTNTNFGEYFYDLVKDYLKLWYSQYSQYYQILSILTWGYNLSRRMRPSRVPSSRRPSPERLVLRRDLVRGLQRGPPLRRRPPVRLVPLPVVRNVSPFRGGSSSSSTSDYGLRGPEFDSHRELCFFLLFPISINQWCFLNQVPRGGATLLSIQISKEK